MLQNHVPSNLNRDDTGSPKDAVFGGYRRARISSQCLKRSIRRSPVFRATLHGEGVAADIDPAMLGVLRKYGIDEVLTCKLGARTRAMPQIVRDILLERGVPEALALEASVVATKLGSRASSGAGSGGETEKGEEHSDMPRTKQSMFLTLGDFEIIADYLKGVIETKGEAGLKRAAEQVSKTGDKRYVIEEELSKRDFGPLPVDIALFGRMVTSEAFVDVEASSQFAHAISTHKVDHEFDYYTAVDDLERAPDDEAGGGADMIGDVEFNSACYYKYFNVHVEGLVDNLTGKAFKRPVTAADEEAARRMAAYATRALLEAACRVTPSGKQNSFAAFQLPSLVWVEIRDTNLPVSYANAFSRPVNPRDQNGLEKASALALKTECETLTQLYGLDARKRVLLTKHDDLQILGVGRSDSLQVLLDQVETEVRGG
jgi:CRISPR system Cascade subunit CasC